MALAVVWAHPHSRGENLLGDLDAHSRLGSSPLTRGKPQPAALYRTASGLIPTHAGKTGLPGVWTYPPQAHPHSRGENTQVVLAAGFGQGSSPLTRGKQIIRIGHGYSGRLIPTHAGKTLRELGLYAPNRSDFGKP